MEPKVINHGIHHAGSTGRTTFDMASPRQRPKRIIRDGINATTHQQAGSCHSVKATINTLPSWSCKGWYNSSMFKARDLKQHPNHPKPHGKSHGKWRTWICVTSKTSDLTALPNCNPAGHAHHLKPRFSVFKNSDFETSALFLSQSLTFSKDAK